MVVKFTLDYFPMLLRSGGVSSGPRPFMFFNAWGDDPELQIVVNKKWEKSRMCAGRF